MPHRLRRAVPSGVWRPGAASPRFASAASARVSLETTDTDSSWPFVVTVHTSQPVLACLGSQYAGWSLSAEDKGKKYSVLGSGPARAIGSSEKLFDELGYRDKAASAVLVLEADRPPPPALVEQVAKACKLKPNRLTFVYAPTSSLAGTVQIAARCLEVALHKAHELHFPLDHIIDGIATAPLPPPAPDFIAAMGRTNDAIIYGGRAQLFVSSGAKEAKALGREFAEPEVEGLRQALRRHLRRGEGRFLRDRPHAVQPGDGDGDLAQDRRELRGRTHRYGRAVALLRLKPWARKEPTTPPSSCSAMAATGMDEASRAPSSGAASRRCSRRSTPAASRPRRRPGFSSRVSATACPKGAFVRFVPGGSFEAVTLYLGVLHALRELGVTVWNDARAIERCVDKSTTTFFLQRAGLPTPRTFARVDRAEAEAIARASSPRGGKLVQKPLFGAQGKGLRLISSLADLASPEEVNGVYYLQEFIAAGADSTIRTGACSCAAAASSPP